jgi:hypothetical protein
MRRGLIGTLVCVFLCMLTAQQALAAVCAPETITARGEAARYEWLAKTKARANWRRKVRATDGLGTDWSVWAQAIENDELCYSGPGSTLCVFTGRPCKR